MEEAEEEEAGANIKSNTGGEKCQIFSLTKVEK